MKLRSVLRLALRRLRHGWKIHLAAMLLTALTGCAFLLYQSYMLQMGAHLGEQTEELTMLADIYVDLPAGTVNTAPAIVTGSWRNRPQPVVRAQGFAFTAGSSYGRLPTIAISPLEGYQGPLPPAGQALVAETLADSLGLPLGEEIDILLPQGKTLTVTLADAYESSPAAAALLISEQWYAQVSGMSGFNRFYYDMPRDLSLAAAQSFLYRFYPGSTIKDRYQPAALARQAIADTYSGGSGLVTLLFVFLALGVLTALLLSFLDSKRELSVLKSLGLTPRELSGLFFGSGLVTAALGIAAAFGLTFGSVALLNARGVRLPLARQELTTMLIWIGVAYLLAIAVPAGLARKATVNQLLYDQAIPLISTQVRGLRGKHPIYEERIAKGWQVVRLPVTDGVFEGFVFKQVGDRVKTGEVLAYVPGWWGLTYTEFVAAIDGTVGLWFPEAGFLGVKPERETDVVPVSYLQTE